MEAEAAISNMEAEAKAEAESMKAWKPKLKVLLAELQLSELQLVGAFAGNWMSMLQLAEAKAGGGEPKDKARSWPEVPKFAEFKLAFFFHFSPFSGSNLEKKVP